MTSHQIGNAGKLISRRRAAAKERTRKISAPSRPKVPSSQKYGSFVPRPKTWIILRIFCRSAGPVKIDEPVWFAAWNGARPW